MSNETNSSLATIGGIFAGLLSWFKWHSVGYAILHAVLGSWIYVLYFWIRYGFHF